MTTANTSGASSMRFSLNEVLSGMLASTAASSFSDDAVKLAAMFEQLAGQFPLFAPLAVGVDPAAVGQALQSLESKKIISRAEGRYVLSDEGRAACRSSKRTLFNRSDSDQLEEAAKVFDTL